jgi:hypothetical protein
MSGRWRATEPEREVTMRENTLCFVLMPFGTKESAAGPIDFDAVYATLYRPAAERAGLEPIRADHEQLGGILHKPMFERLNLCSFALADLSLANANVYYELGIRHAVRRHSTVLTIAEGERIPIDLGPNRVDFYPPSAVHDPDRAAAIVDRLVDRLHAAAHPVDDSPIYQLLGDWPELSHSKTDVFYDRVREDQRVRDRLAEARRRGRVDGPAAVDAVVAGLGDVATADPAVVVDALLSYRAVESWGGMVHLVERLDAPLRVQPLVQEQYGLALNRAGRSDDAVAVLERSIEDHGATPENCGILGRVYKDRWQQAGDGPAAPGLLRKAIEAYRRGFEADWRDAYPGVNLLTLLHSRDPHDPEIARLTPVVRYAVVRKMSQRADYWDHATLLELAVLAGDREAARDALGDALASPSESFMPASTAANLRTIARRVRAAVGPGAGGPGAGGPGAAGAGATEGRADADADWIDALAEALAPASG